MNQIKEPEFASTIEQYLNYENNAATPIPPKELIAFVRARTGLTAIQCKIIISAIFSEIINIILLKNKRFALDDFGELFLSKTGRLMWSASERFKEKINVIFK